MNTPINNKIAMTGEINLKGHITAIGGLELKIIGGIKAGVKTFLYPKANARDFNEWKNKFAGNSKINEIEFYEVSNIQEVFDYAFV
jgi:ATP-dependent Lon protease